MDPHTWLNKFYNLYMTTVVSVGSRHGLTIEAHCRNQTDKSIPALYTCKQLFHFKMGVNK